MWNKVVLRKTGRNIVFFALLLAVFSLFGCTTGVRKDPGLSDFQAPEIPKSIVGEGRERAILLSWAANTEADLVGYKVYRSNNSGGPFTLVATVGTQAAPSFFDNDQQNGLVNDQYYYYKISAFDTQGNESDLSRTNALQVRAGLPAEKRPPRVVNLKARSSRDAAYVSWDKITSRNVKGYNIYRGLSSTAGGVQWISSVPHDTPGFVDSSVTLSSSEQYTYIIRSFNEEYSESENSDPIQITLKQGDATIPRPPFELAISNDVDPIVSWRKPTNNEDGSNIFTGDYPTLDLDSYLIFRASSNDGLFSLIGIVEDNGTANMTQTFKDVNGTPYNLYAVRALDRNGSVSRLSSITTQSSDADLPAIPNILKAWSSSSTESAIRLAWEASRNAISYNIYFSMFPDGGFTKMLTGQPHWSETSPYVINTFPSNYPQNPEKNGRKLEFGIPYYFRVSAVSSSGKESELSPMAMAYPGGLFVAILEGENPTWEYVPRDGGTQVNHMIVYTSKDYPQIDYYSGAGAAFLFATTVGTNGDIFRYDAAPFGLPSPATTGSYAYNVYAYYFPHTTGGNWRVRIRDDSLLSSTLLEKDLNGYGSVNKGRTVTALGQIQLSSGRKGVRVEMTATAAGSGGYATLFFDALVFVRVM